MKRVVLLDVSAIMYRAFYANMNFKTKKEPTGAIYGFVNTLLAIIDKFNPESIVGAMDVKRSSLNRSKLYSEYKSQRDAVPEDLLRQIPRIEELLDNFGVKRFKIEGYEADDILGSLAKKFKDNGYEVFIVTGDKDLSQILAEGINIALLGKGDGGGFKILSTDEDVKEQLGVIPTLIPDLFGLIGDKSDGIPGVRKIGPKKAIAMLEKYGTLEKVYENIDELGDISGVGKSLIQNMKEDKELAFLSKKLATIEIIDLDIEIDTLKYEIDRERLYDFFKELEFKSLIKKMGLENNEVQNLQMGLFSTLEQKKERTLLIKKLENIEELDKEIAIYMGKDRVAISSNSDNYIVSSDELRKILDTDRKIISYNLKNLLNKGYQIKGDIMDTMLGYHLLTSQTKESVENMIRGILGEEIVEYVDLFGKKEIDEIDEREYDQYLIERSSGILRSYYEMRDELKEKNLDKVLERIELPLIEVLSYMELNGIQISPDYFIKLEIELENRIEELKNAIYKIAGKEFNINSTKQLGEILFVNLNIPPVKKTKTGYSTDSEVLEKLKEQGYEIALNILEFRKLVKLKTTYVEPLPKMVDKNNRIHTTFNQTGTATGRLSSSEPNLQNIPVRTEDGIKIRGGFVAKDGYLLLGIDYSQIELRVLAEISKDPILIEAYKNNLDLHSLTARKVFQLKEGDTVTREQRDMAKVINFSIIYGKTAYGLSQELKITPKEASEYIDRYFSEYPKVKELEKNIIKFAEENGYTETFFKRRRIIDGINSMNKTIKAQAERMAVNSVIQGTASEILKKVMRKIYDEIKDNDEIKMLLQVHDELIFEVEESKALFYKEKLEKIMRESIKFENVVLEVNGAVGKNWAEAK